MVELPWGLRKGCWSHWASRRAKVSKWFAERLGAFGGVPALLQRRSGGCLIRWRHEHLSQLPAAALHLFLSAAAQPRRAQGVGRD